MPTIREYRSRPERRSGTADTLTLNSFIELTKRHMDENSVVFANTDWRSPSLVAVIDYHSIPQEDPGAQADGARPFERIVPANLKHRIEYSFPLSEEWQAWIEKNAMPMKQGDFAAFLEDRIAELTAPGGEQAALEAMFQTKIADPAEILMLSRGLQISVQAPVKNAGVLQSGETEMIFEEVHRDGGGQKLVVPGLFMISVPVFFRGAPVRLPVRLRYRVNQGQIVWFYQLWRPEEYVTDQLDKDIDAVRVETGLPVYEGSPEVTG